MAYIGNGRTLLILGSNVRDDLVPSWKPGTNPTQDPSIPFDQNVFTLSQEVPGGYESNVYVFRQKYITERLITNSTSGQITIPQSAGTTFTVTSSNTAIAAALSDIKETIKLYADSNHKLTISGSAIADNNGTFQIVGCTYDGSTITITLNKNNSVGGGNQASSTESGSYTISRGYSGFWEVLEPDVDYKIVGEGANLNRQIEFINSSQGGIAIPMLADDKIYVIHKGDATYNLVPSDNSVGPNQLSQNLRNFTKDTFTGNGSEVNFSLSQEAVNDKAILVTVNGAVQEGEPLIGGTVSSNSDYGLNTFVSPNIIKFRVAPASGAKIRVLHLGFSTVSRRLSLSPGQVTTSITNDSVVTSSILNGAVTEPKLATNSVSTSKIVNNAVNSDKILLDNNTSLRSLNSSASVVPLLTLNSSNQTVLNSPGTTSLSFNSTAALNFTSTTILPQSDNVISLGSSSLRFTTANFSGAVNTGAITASGNISTTGTLFSTGNISTDGTLSTNGNITVPALATVDGVDISVFKTTTDAAIVAVNDALDLMVPIGTIVQYGGRATSATLINDKWMICDGASLVKATYPSLWNLFTANGNPSPYGDSGLNFNLPDLRRRVPIGAGTTSPFSLGQTDALGETSRTLTHSHNIPGHNHGMKQHTHFLPAHYHTMDTTLGSTLNINSTGGVTAADKGGHTTTIPINHGHTSSTTSTDILTTGADAASPAPTTTTFAEELGWFSWSDPGHSHNTTNPINSYTATGNTGEMSNNESHGHAVNTSESAGNTGAAGGHNHRLRLEASGSSTTNTINVNSTANSSNLNLSNSLTEAVGDHRHSVTIMQASIPHHHSIPKNPAGISITNSQHIHKITIPNLSPTVSSLDSSITRTDSNPANAGIHMHAAATFNGSIGHVTSNANGNANGTSTTNSNWKTFAPSDNNTDNNTPFSSDPQSNSPYIVLNYIIRVK